MKAKILCLFLLWGLIGFGIGNSYNPLTLTSNLLLDGYKIFISPLQGENVCHFSPTCSRYAKEAINRYGFFLGLLMSADRLERCNPFAPIYAQDYYSGEKEGRIFDPPSAHTLSANKKGRILLGEIFKVTIDTFRFFLPGEPYDLAFADFLYQEREFSLAQAEYLKVKFWTNDNRIREYARIMLGECYAKNGNYQKAKEEISGVKNKELRWLSRGKLFLEEGKFDSARSQLYYIKDTTLKTPAQLLYGLSYLYEGDWVRGLSFFKIKDLSPPKRKFPLLSGFFSLILPGAGQVYSERVGDGLYSFLVVGTLAGISYYYGKEQEKGKFWTFLSFTSLFHLGNVYGAIIAARDCNLRAKKRFIKMVEEKISVKDYKIDLKEFLLRL